MKIVNIDEARKNKLESKKLNPDSHENDNKDEKTDNKMNDDTIKFEDVDGDWKIYDDFDMLENTSYLYVIDNLEVEFGAEFAKDLIIKIDENKTEILKSIEISNDRSKYYLGEMMDKDSDQYKLLLKTLVNQKELMETIINEMKTVYDLDEMFQDGSKFLNIIGFVLTIAMVHSYSELDYYRMVRDEWLELSTSVDRFINSKLYEEIQQSGHED